MDIRTSVVLVALLSNVGGAVVLPDAAVVHAQARSALAHSNYQTIELLLERADLSIKQASDAGKFSTRLAYGATKYPLVFDAYRKIVAKGYSVTIDRAARSLLIAW